MKPASHGYGSDTAEAGPGFSFGVRKAQSGRSRARIARAVAAKDKAFAQATQAVESSLDKEQQQKSLAGVLQRHKAQHGISQESCRVAFNAGNQVFSLRGSVSTQHDYLREIDAFKPPNKVYNIDKLFVAYVAKSQKAVEVREKQRDFQSAIRLTPPTGEAALRQSACWRGDHDHDHNVPLLLSTTLDDLQTKHGFSDEVKQGAIMDSMQLRLGIAKSVFAARLQEYRPISQVRDINRHFAAFVLKVKGEVKEIEDNQVNPGRQVAQQEEAVWDLNTTLQVIAHNYGIQQVHLQAAQQAGEQFQEAKRRNYIIMLQSFAIDHVTRDPDSHFRLYLHTILRQLRSDDTRDDLPELGSARGSNQPEAARAGFIHTCDADQTADKVLQYLSDDRQPKRPSKPFGTVHYGQQEAEQFLQAPAAMMANEFPCMQQAPAPMQQPLNDFFYACMQSAIAGYEMQRNAQGSQATSDSWPSADDESLAGDFGEMALQAAREEIWDLEQQVQEVSCRGAAKAILAKAYITALCTSPVANVQHESFRLDEDDEQGAGNQGEDAQKDLEAAFDAFEAFIETYEPLPTVPAFPTCSTPECQQQSVGEQQDYELEGRTVQLQEAAAHCMPPPWASALSKEDERASKVCTFYVKGRCGRGEKCPYKHIAAERGIAKGKDWVCLDCDDWQFGRNAVCRKCGKARPADSDAAQRSSVATAGCSRSPAPRPLAVQEQPTQSSAMASAQQTAQSGAQAVQVQAETAAPSRQHELTDEAGRLRYRVFASRTSGFHYAFNAQTGVNVYLLDAIHGLDHLEVTLDQAQITAEIEKLKAVRALGAAPQCLPAYPKVVQEIYKQQAMSSSSGAPAAATPPPAPLPGAVGAIAPGLATDIVAGTSPEAVGKLFAAVGLHRTEEAIKQMLQDALSAEGSTEGLTVKQLQAVLRAKKLQTTGVKAMLIARLENACTPCFNGVKFTKELVTYALQTMA